MTPAEELHLETWIEYGFCTSVVLLRMAVRLRTLGIMGLQLDDILMPLAWGYLTAISLAADIVSANGDNANLGDDVARLGITENDPALANKLKKGSQFFMVGWFTYTSFLWTLKLCMLLFLQRITQGLWIERLVRPLMAAVLLFWVAIFTLILSLCRPFYKYWQKYPDSGSQPTLIVLLIAKRLQRRLANCTPETPVFYFTVLILNLVTDACIVTIPLPAGSMVLLSTGVCVMVAAILRVVFVSTVREPSTPAIWACRETLVAITAINAPLLLPIFQRKFWTFSYGRKNGTAKSESAGDVEMTDKRKHRKRFGHHLDIESTFLRGTKHRTIVDIKSSSTEHIATPGAGVVHVRKSYNVGSIHEEG